MLITAAVLVVTPIAIAARPASASDLSAVERATPPVASVITGEVEARLIALACTAPPAGYGRWSLRLLEKHVALVEEIPNWTTPPIGRVLKRRNFVLI